MAAAILFIAEIFVSLLLGLNVGTVFQSKGGKQKPANYQQELNILKRQIT